MLSTSAAYVDSKASNNIKIIKNEGAILATWEPRVLPLICSHFVAIVLRSLLSLAEPSIVLRNGVVVARRNYGRLAGSHLAWLRVGTIAA